MTKSTLDKIIEEIKNLQMRAYYCSCSKEGDALSEAIEIIQRHAKKRKAVKREKKV